MQARLWGDDPQRLPLPFVPMASSCHGGGGLGLQFGYLAESIVFECIFSASSLYLSGRSDEGSLMPSEGFSSPISHFCCVCSVCIARSVLLFCFFSDSRFYSGSSSKCCCSGFKRGTWGKGKEKV